LVFLDAATVKAAAAEGIWFVFGGFWTWRRQQQKNGGVGFVVFEGFGAATAAAELGLAAAATKERRRRQRL
jgi:hypothetical protein